MNTKKHTLEVKSFKHSTENAYALELRVDGGLLAGRVVTDLKTLDAALHDFGKACRTAEIPTRIWVDALQRAEKKMYAVISEELRDKPLPNLIQQAISGSQHITVYGPAASGKTYNAVKLATFFRCNVLMDNPTPKDLARLSFIPKALVLNHTPVKGTINISINDALQAAGLRGPSKYFGPPNSLEEFLGTITADQDTTKKEPDYILGQKALWEAMRVDNEKAQQKIRDTINEAQARIESRIKRKLTDHLVNPCNEKIEITVLDDPGDGGANHLYLVEGIDPSKNKSWKGRKFQSTAILFQNGPIPENGTNGITQEVLLAIVADRLRGFQSGPFACKDNACALTHIEEALMWLQRRTIERTKRGVEGQHIV